MCGRHSDGKKEEIKRKETKKQQQTAFININGVVSAKHYLTFIDAGILTNDLTQRSGIQQAVSEFAKKQLNCKMSQSTRIQRYTRINQ